MCVRRRTLPGRSSFNPRQVLSRRLYAAHTQNVRIHQAQGSALPWTLEFPLLRVSVSRPGVISKLKFYNIMEVKDIYLRFWCTNIDHIGDIQLKFENAM